MPKQYEAIRDKFTSEGMPLAEAKTRAAKIYNSTHHDNPVTGQHKMANGGEIGFHGVGSVPTLGVSYAYPPPTGSRVQGPRNYGKK